MQSESRGINMFAIHVKEVFNPFQEIYRYGYLVHEVDNIIKRMYFDCIEDAVNYWDRLSEDDIVGFWDVDSVGLIMMKKQHLREEFHHLG